MKRSNMNQRSFRVSAFACGVAMASSLLFLGCAADTDPGDADNGVQVTPVVDRASGIGTPIPVPAAPAHVVGDEAADTPLPIPPAVPDAKGEARTLSDGEADGTTLPVPAFTKP